jgi:DNA-binding transcriptional LysR family regulator
MATFLHKAIARRFSSGCVTSARIQVGTTVKLSDMETRQLSYFILACQHKNHAEGAARTGLSASALSENLNLLERELGLTMFQRGPLGHFPTEAARWLYQAAEPILQLAEAAETLLNLPVSASIERIEISSPLQFMLGRLSRAASLAVRELRKIHPGILATVRFADSASPGPEESTTLELPVHEEPSPVGRVVLDYAENGDGAEGTLLFLDEWLCVTSAERSADGRRTVPFETLRTLPLFLPSLAPAQIRLARAYCTAHDLPDPMVIEEDVGTFPRLSRDAVPFCLLAPQSLVAGGLARLNLGSAKLPVDLTSKVVARVTADHPVARNYVSLLRDIVQDPEPTVHYDPKITLKQMRYFLTLCDQLNVTAAARKLHVVQPALSNQLRKLESVVGRKLFHRRRTGLEPTLDTQRLVELFTPAIARSDRIVFRAAHYAATRHERLSIGFIPMINHDGPLVRAITAALEEWGRTYPNAKLQVREAPTQTLHRWVESGAISFALVEAHVSRTSQLDLNTRDMLGVVSNTAAPLLPPGNVPLRRLTGIPLVLPGEAFGLRQILDRAADEANTRLIPQMEVNSLTMILAMIRRMPLATILPQPSVQPYVDAGVFQFNAIVEPAISRRLSILFSPARSLTEIERSLIAIFRQNLAIAGFAPAAASDSAPDDARRSRTPVH